jgi:hypothetical protein
LKKGRVREQADYGIRELALARFGGSATIARRDLRAIAGLAGFELAH